MKNKKRGVTVGSRLSFMFSDTLILFYKLLFPVADDYAMVAVAESKWKLASRKASILSFEH